MSDYTPTTEDVAEAWAARYDGEHASASGDERRGYEAEFDRWLAAHDAALRAEWEAEQDWEYAWAGESDCEEWITELTFATLAEAEKFRTGRSWIADQCGIIHRRRAPGPWLPVEQEEE